MNLEHVFTNRVLRVLRAAQSIGQWSTVGVVGLVVSLLGSPAHGGPIGSALGPWHSISWKEVPAGTANQGLATVTSPGRRSHLVTRGESSVSAALTVSGWSHIGDPGSRRGYVLDAYQAHPGKRAKLFLLTAPTGHHTQWTHRDVRGEMVNNSFVAIARPASGSWEANGARCTACSCTPRRS